ncbi:MAG: 3D domain-containing protein [Pyrinomonadaceae bacterium]
MKNIVRGGAILSVVCMLVVLIYAQTTTEKDPIIANDSQTKIKNNNVSDINLVSNKSINLGGNTSVSADSVSNDDKESDKGDKKLVKKTGSVRAAGASRGSFTATAYCLKGRTAMGHGVRRGIIAADPRVLKLGSTIVISAGPWSGTYLVSDTGGKIKGKRLDIWVPGCSEARKFGRRTVQVFSPQ